VAVSIRILPDPGTVTEPGLYAMSDEAYFADPVPGGSLSQSRAKILLQEGGPAKLIGGEPATSAEFDFGKVAHAVILGKGSDYTVLPGDDLRLRPVREATDAAKAAGLIPVRQRDWQRIQAMAAAVTAHPLAASLLGMPGEREVAAFTVDEPTGVWLRGKVDLLAGACVVDYKTSADASPSSWSRAALTYGYATQDAMYRRLTGRDRMFFVVQDKTPPYLVAVVELDDDYRAIGERNLRRAIDLYAECRAAGRWPGYGDDLITLSPPAWALRDLEADLAEEQAAAIEALIERTAS